MAELELLVDLDSCERSSALGLGSPIGTAELEDLRWYLEDYLQTPFGVYSERGSRIAGQLAGWGRALFDSVLAPDRLCGRGLAELVVRSQMPERLALPWELMRAPGASGPLVLDGIGVTRCLAAGAADGSVDVAGERLRVLMVISRPANIRDVGYQMIARPLLRSMAAAHGEVDLEVLRPPTLDALTTRLREACDAGAPFQVVHFDGHGVAADEGALLFERTDGGADYVPAGRLAEVLAAAQVSVAVLNACQSGAIGKRLEAAVATRLLSGGIAAVVAMSYRVYAVAAAEFMTAFYGQLLSGGTVGEAVRAGRLRMAWHPRRPSPKGELPLEDWAVPVYYRRRELRFPRLRAAPSAATVADPGGDPLAQEEEFVGRDDLFCSLETAARTARVLLLHGPGGTGKTELAKAFGRWWRETGGVDRPDGVLWHSFEPGVPSLGLDGAIREAGLRLFGSGFALKGPGASRDAVLEQLRARRLLLVWDNLESVATMPGDITAPLDDAARADLKDFLREAAEGQSTILVTSRTPENWLGDVCRLAVGGLHPHEAVEYADQLLAPHPAAAARRADRSFAELLDWLAGYPLSMRLTLPHLATTDPATLLAGLRGTQPLPMAEEALAEGDARSRSLTASVRYSIVHLPPDVRRLLVALSLFSAVADAEILGTFSAREHTPQRFRDVSVRRWGAVLDKAAHLGLLTAHADGGYGIHPALPAYLAEQWRAEESEVYPDERAAADRALLDAYAMVGEQRGRAMDTDADTQTESYAFIDRNRHTMERLLGYALDEHLWSEAQSLFIVLQHYLNLVGLHHEASRWSDRALRALAGASGVPAAVDLPALRLEDVHEDLLRDPSTLSPQEASEYLSIVSERLSAVSRWSDAMPALSLWVVVAGERAGRLTRAGDLDAAESRYLQILRLKERIPGYPRGGLADTYRELGSVAKERGRLADAQEMYRKALAIHEEAGDREGIAASLRRLGDVAQDLGHWDEAERRYRQALAVLNELTGHLHHKQLTYSALGRVMEDRGRLDEAEEWYVEALTLAEQRHDWDGTARSAHGLGNLARKSGQLAESERWFQRCLSLAEKVLDRRGMAVSYFELGMVALLRGQDESEDWFHRSLALHEHFDDSAGVARIYRMLGLIAIARHQADEARRLLSDSLAIVEQIGRRDDMLECYQLLGGLEHGLGRWNEAENWLRRGIALGVEMGNEARVATSYVQLGMLVDARGDTAEALEPTVRGLALIRRFPQSAVWQERGQALRSVTKRLGIDAVEECWKRVTGEPLPDDILRLTLPEQGQSQDEPPASR